MPNPIKISRQRLTLIVEQGREAAGQMRALREALDQLDGDLDRQKLNANLAYTRGRDMEPNAQTLERIRLLEEERQLLLARREALSQVLTPVMELGRRCRQYALEHGMEVAGHGY